MESVSKNQKVFNLIFKICYLFDSQREKNTRKMDCSYKVLYKEAQTQTQMIL